MEKLIPIVPDGVGGSIALRPKSTQDHSAVETVEIRPYDKAVDYAYIASTWLHSFENSATSMRLYRGDTYAYEQAFRPLIDELIDISTINIAAPTGDPTTIVGYLVYQPLTGEIHYVYSRIEGHGIASLLLEGFKLSEWVATFGTIDSLRICRFKQGRGEPIPQYLPIIPSQKDI